MEDNALQVRPLDNLEHILLYVWSKRKSKEIHTRHETNNKLQKTLMYNMNTTLPSTDQVCQINSYSYIVLYEVFLIGILLWAYFDHYYKSRLWALRASNGDMNSNILLWECSQILLLCPYSTLLFFMNCQNVFKWRNKMFIVNLIKMYAVESTFCQPTKILNRLILSFT